MKPDLLSQDDLKELLRHPHRSLGKGAQGTVYLVKYKGVDCCLKLASRQQDPERFLYEGEVLKKLKGAGGAPRLLGATENEGRRLGLLTTFCGDDTFMQLSRVARTDDEMLHAFVQLCLGVHKVHARGYVHNDIKANNVVVRRDAHDGRVHVSLIDYGLAQRTGVPLLSHVRTYNRLAWMAPEVYQCAPCRPSMDVYSLGHLLKEILAQCKGSYPGLQEMAQRAMAVLPKHRPSLKVLTKTLERCLLPHHPATSPSLKSRLRSLFATREAAAAATLALPGTQHLAPAPLASEG
ncbi:serine/threonine-protein kinase PkaB-like [Scylla paramamosain]|uniref:serine/threonine-protein kinase PkaB-like n=1 Tax=Scylla paramamosain TaxID=85552 RepID=UPI003083D061